MAREKRRMKYYSLSVSIGDPYNTYTYIVAAPNKETAEFLAKEQVKKGHAIDEPRFVSVRELNYTHSVVGIIVEVYTGP